MNRPTALLLVVAVVAGYGVYIASYLPAMLVSPPAPLLLIVGFVLQVVFALAAAVGIWLARRWGTVAILLLGASVAATWLVEAIIFGIVAYGRALLMALLAVVVAWLLATYVHRQRRPRTA